MLLIVLSSNQVDGKTLHGTWKVSFDLVELDWLETLSNSGTYARIEHEYYCKSLFGKSYYDKFEFNKVTFTGEQNAKMDLDDLLCDYHRDNSRGRISVTGVSAVYSYIKLKGDNFEFKVTFHNYLTLTDESDDDYYYIKLRVDHGDGDYEIFLRNGHGDEIYLEEYMDASEYTIDFQWT